MTSYFARSPEDDPGQEDANELTIEVIREVEGVRDVVGKYHRNFYRNFDSFCAFRRDGKDYALYSPDYTTTRVMTLPDCHDIGGEEPHTHGFCPIDYLVPDEAAVGPLAGRFGLVFGCVWAWPCQIQFLDLSDVQHGVVRRSDLLVPSITVQQLSDFKDMRLRDCLECDLANDGSVAFSLKCALEFRVKPDGSGLRPEPF